MTDNPESADSTALPDSSSLLPNEPRVSTLGGVAERAGHSTLAEELAGILRDMNEDARKRALSDERIGETRGYLQAILDVDTFLTNGVAITGELLSSMATLRSQR